MNQSDLALPTAVMTVDELAARCRHESAAAADRRDPRYCLELFRRAIVGRDNAAWTAIYAQYHALVRCWLSDIRNADDLVQETFGRFHGAVTAERFAAGEFPTLGSMLAFLRTTAINLLINERRRTERERRALGLRWGPRDDAPDAEEPEPVGGFAPDYLADVARQELADYVRSLVPDETEWLALRLSYEYELPPREIARSHPQRFRDAAEVSRIKERVKKRLQNDPRLRRWLED